MVLANAKVAVMISAVLFIARVFFVGGRLTGPRAYPYKSD